MNDKYQIVIQPEAQKAIEEAYFWFSNISPYKDRTWIEGLYKSILSLEKMPYRCSLAFENEFFEQELRQLIYGQERTAYRIIFTIVDDNVQILFVRHTAQKPIVDESE
ncbi:type II toxin-antitoxin system RelE/ParE family toxin [Anabaena sp. UHCC 0253]|uniref:type II toxin-antitoxin system RelE/ParE family toxin n=1 Tax=Anabaena sp. UHCC 0253 TaxID=2590019 RepID=UPI00144602E7|nr:type II toxin-antitoxin system RelE/ParE family toxin [Anabaena sp. UHCC 0253]MTJ51495.1 type II toxin-antitoxin system RelE/ParE family toxin [Anabaena sp. UHCC 0253]